jgi:hypothetical protein
MKYLIYANKNKFKNSMGIFASLLSLAGNWLGKLKDKSEDVIAQKKKVRKK